MKSSENVLSATTIIDGKATAAVIREELKVFAERLTTMGHRPGLAVVLVGDAPASQVYVRHKDRAAEAAGFHVETLRLPATTTQAELTAEVERLNEDANIHGILVQLPLPGGGDLNEAETVCSISPDKDVDGLHPLNVARLVMGEPGFVPCTPAGCIELLDRYAIPIAGQQAVVVGRSMLVGKPVAQLLLARNATVTICHSRTVDLASHCRSADILIAAVGREGLVRGDWVKPGAAVLDVGINRGSDGKLHGDVSYQEVFGRAGALTPVPGGVGPMTIAMLLSNTANSAARAAGLETKSSPVSPD